MGQTIFKHPFSTRFNDIVPVSKSIDEKLVIQSVNYVRLKPNWQTQFKNKATVRKWLAEMAPLISDKTNHVVEVLQFAIYELFWTIAVEKENLVKIKFDSLVVYTDDVSNGLSERFKELSLGNQDLKSLSIELEKDFGKDLDYHLGSNNTVVDLVHPSLFPVQYGRTVAVKGSIPFIVEYDNKRNTQFIERYGISKSFQWLPSLFVLKDNRYQIDSYINNLDSLKYKSLYGSIENVFNSIIPQLNYVLSRYALEEYIRVKIDEGDRAYKLGYSDAIGRLWEDSILGMAYELPPYFIARERIKREHIKEYIPEYHPPRTDKSIDLKSDFSELKVIVKLANIELTPENPEYGGSSWHVEGTINEDIVATVLYFYDVDNITESKISFRTFYECPWKEFSDGFYLEHLFGLKDEDPLLEELGDITCQEHRVVIYPNYYHHKDEPFALRDPTKPGHRKVLCFFLVDPYNSSTLTSKEVPPQQEEWWKSDIIMNLIPEEELRELILKLQTPPNLADAKVVREMLMRERRETPIDEYLHLWLVFLL